ncbi:MAG: YraN family protein [Hydrogenophilaceae bacterium]|jgi:putative endonuclease|nr:YraN family protein [Hydrogenophilaceae bacterium]
MSGDKRAAAERRGRFAEHVAMAWLMCKGYRILGHRVRTPFGEIDIAAFKGGVLAIVEVKMRRSIEAGLEALLPRQQERLANAAMAAARRWRLEGALLRFDVMVVGAGALPRHVRGAWGRDRPT